MRLTARVFALSAVLGLAAAGLAGCGSTSTEVHAPKFTVPTPPPLEQQGRRGSAGQANTFLTSWVHGLSQAADPDVHGALAHNCHDDPGCLRLVRVAAKLPQPAEDQYYENWSVGFTQGVRADPKHANSWSVVIRPTWQTFEELYQGRYDGWTTRTLVNVRMQLVGKDARSDWRLWLTPVPGSGPGDGSVSLTNPKYGDI